MSYSPFPIGSGVSYQPIICYVKNIALATGALVPADIATIPIPLGITRWRPGWGSSTAAGGMACYMQSSTGSVDNGVAGLYSAPNGAGDQLVTTLTLPSTQGNSAVGASSSATVFSTSGIVYIRQTAASMSTGLASFYINVWPIP